MAGTRDKHHSPCSVLNTALAFLALGWDLRDWVCLSCLLPLSPRTLYSEDFYMTMLCKPDIRFGSPLPLISLASSPAGSGCSASATGGRGSLSQRKPRRRGCTASKGVACEELRKRRKKL